MHIFQDKTVLQGEDIGFQYCQYPGLGRHIGQYAGLGRDIGQYAGLGRDIGQYASLGRDIDSTEIQYHLAYMIMSISHPWPCATGEYAALRPHYVALGPQDAALGLRAPLYRPRAASWGPLAT